MVWDVADMVNYTEACASGRSMIHTFGGLIGEIILVFTACQDFIESQPSSIGYKFTSEQFETFFTSLIEKDGGKIYLPINGKFDVVTDDKGETTAADIFQQLKFVKQNMALPGLKFLLDTAVDTVLNHEVIDEVLKSVLNVVRKKNFYLDSLEINKDDHHNEQLTPTQKNHKSLLFDKIFVQECTPEQAQLNELSKYDCFMKVRNFREVPFGSIEAKQDHSQSQLQEATQPILAQQQSK